MLTSLIHIVGKKTQRGVDKNKFIIETWLLSILVYFGMLPLKLLFVYASFLLSPVRYVMLYVFHFETSGGR